ncbi:MAG: hypothetical protein DYG94_12910 [Leptolyngbya sp. PLA3]|nr:MAG: hypothetical protein EDM82_12240 [Cyanobacteria bacterium CYA]MCE7969625.1 hypothetical protein [Leptolyngbya sp. PL-A3]
MHTGDPSIAGSIRPDTSGSASNPRSSRLAGLIASRVYTSHQSPSEARRTIVDSIDLGSVPGARQPRAEQPDATIPFYTNPARRNEVATQIALGRSLDINA